MEAFVEAVRRASQDPEALDTALSALAPSWLSTSDWVRSKKDGYTRSLVFRDERVEVVVITWAPNARTPIHDHGGQRSWMRVVRGALEITTFRQVRRGHFPGELFIEPMGRTRLLSEEKLEAPPVGLDLHQVRTAPTVPFAVSVHVYSRPLDHCRVFDVHRGRSEERRMRYDFIGARTRREPSPLGVHLPSPESRGVRGYLSRLVRRAREVGEDLLVPTNVGEAGSQMQVQGVGHHYGSVEALRDVSLNVRSGEFVCLLGPSGCGKSTLLYALAGHVKPTGGAVSLDGRPITRPGPERLLMFQDAALFPWLTVEQNITFVLAARQLPRRQRRLRAREFIRRVQLEGFEDALPHQLSGGMKMRASLARSLAIDPPVLLMDEPFGSLDAQTRLKMQRLLQSLWKERKSTIVFVTHDVHEALLLGTRVVVMAARPGRVVLDAEVRLAPERDPDDPHLAALAHRLRETMSGNPSQFPAPRHAR